MKKVVEGNGDAGAKHGYWGKWEIMPERQKKDRIRGR
jgi:hypothetical protein